MISTRKLLALLAVLTIGGLGACKDLEAPDFNNPSIDELQESPTRSGAIAAATGLLIGARDNIAEFNGYVSLLGILGRESYNLDGADTRFIIQMLGVDGTPLDGGARALGGNLWALRYRNIRNANVLLAALDALPDVPPDGMTAAEKEATRGFAKTIQALDFLLIINTRDENGAPIDVGRGLDEEPAPIVGKAEVFDHIVSLLEEARGHLEAGGGSFPFPLSAGFVGFDTPATFLLFNRGLLGRVQVYRIFLTPGGAPDAAAATAALDALEDSFLSEGASLDLGVFHTFGTGSGDRLSALVDPDLYAHISIREDAQLQENGVDPDARFLRKLCTTGVDCPSGAEPRTLLDVFSDLRFEPLYPSPTTPVPIIRNEELILLRAEANIALGNLSEAADDINLIRERSGNLPERDDLDASNILDELLYNKRYSLLFEGGHRWIDARRYDRLDRLPLDQPNHTVHALFPIPVDEINARQ